VNSTKTQLLINGQFVPAAAGGAFIRCNPWDGSVATEAAAADAAQAALPKWAAPGPNARRALLHKAADSLAAKAPELIAAMQAEIGATQAWAGFNIHLATGMIREAAALTTQMSGTVIPSDKPGCLAMAPWNAPVILGVRAIATPLACGNTVVPHRTGPGDRQRGRGARHTRPADAGSRGLTPWVAPRPAFERNPCQTQP